MIPETLPTMMTPRQGSMGNKMYTLQVKYQGMKENISLAPDTSIEQLKKKINSKFNITPDDQELIANGRILTSEGHKTLKQAKLLNGSKIVCNKVGRRKELKSSSKPMFLEEDIMREQFQIKLDTVEETSHELCVSLDKIVEQVNHTKGKSVNNETDKSDLKSYKVEVGGLGERLMQQLEELDQLHLSDQDTELRVRKKKAANKLNAALDRIDSIKEEIKEFVKMIP